MFIEVFYDNFNKNCIINSDCIKKFFYSADIESNILYFPKIETKDGEVYCLTESVCENEARYIIDATIQQIKNPKDTTNKIEPYDIKNYYEENTFLAYHDNGIIKSTEELGTIIENILGEIKVDGEEYNNFKLSVIAQRILTPDQLKLFEKSLDEYRKNIDMVNPTLSRYLW